MKSFLTYSKKIIALLLTKFFLQSLAALLRKFQSKSRKSSSVSEIETALKSIVIESKSITFSTFNTCYLLTNLIISITI